MNWLAKLFKGTFSAAPSPNPNISEPERELPIDEAFVKNFKDKGGIFVYVEKKEDLPKVFQTVVSEAGEDTFVFTHNEQLEEQLSAEFPDCFITNDQLATHFLTDCEYLVAEEGSVMFSSRQLGQKRLDELPSTLIVVAKISQIVGSLMDAMGGLNRQTYKERPNNIRSLRAFCPPEEKDSIFCENCYRTTYLLLLEDLNTNE